MYIYKYDCIHPNILFVEHTREYQKETALKGERDAKRNENPNCLHENLIRFKCILRFPLSNPSMVFSINAFAPNIFIRSHCLSLHHCKRTRIFRT